MDHTALLSSIPLFQSLDREAIGALAAKLEERHYAEGDVVFREGEAGATLFIIEHGAVDISYGVGKAAVDLATLGPGRFFGELSLLDGSPRSATATVIKPALLLALARDAFVEFVRRDPDAAVTMMAELGERMRQTNALMSRQVSRNVLEEAEVQLTFGQRVADSVAGFGGSWPFIGIFGLFMSLWMLTNILIRGPFDAYPFILLNLMLSTVAALQAPIIMMSQNRQAAKDKLLAQNDYQVNLKSEMGIDRLLHGQAEILARMELVERRIGVSPRE